MDGFNVFQVAIAPDNPNIFVVTSENETGDSGPKRIWYDDTGGLTGWTQMYNGAGLEADETIRCLDISADYGGSRDVAFGTVGGTNGGRWVNMPSGDW